MLVSRMYRNRNVKNVMVENNSNYIYTSSLFEITFKPIGESIQIGSGKFAALPSNDTNTPARGHL